MLIFDIDKVNTSQMNFKKSGDKPVKIIQKNGKNTSDDKSFSNSPVGFQVVEKPVYSGKHGGKFMNRAQIYQAVKKARLRQDNLNNDLTLSNFGVNKNDFINVSKGKIKITVANGNQNMYLKKTSKYYHFSYLFCVSTYSKKK